MKTSHRKARFDNLPYGVQLACYGTVILEIERKILEAMHFILLIGGNEEDLRLCFGGVVERFAYKHGPPLTNQKNESPSSGGNRTNGQSPLSRQNLKRSNEK